LEEWTPRSVRENPRSAKWLKNRRRTYKRALEDLGITEDEAPGLLRVMIISPACKYNMKDVVPIGGNGAKRYIIPHIYHMFIEPYVMLSWKLQLYSALIEEAFL
jgi:hypothetical protein